MVVSRATERFQPNRVTAHVAAHFRLMDLVAFVAGSFAVGQAFAFAFAAVGACCKIDIRKRSMT